MVEAELTKKALQEARSYYCGYCDIQEATRWLPEVGYNAGVYGWNCTAYACGDFLLVTGYRPAGAWRLTREECQRLNAAPRSLADLQSLREAAEVTGQSWQTLAVIAELSSIHRERVHARQQARRG